MTFTVANTLTNNSVLYLLTRVNELAYGASALTVTVNSNGAIGNATVNGTITAFTIAANTIGGGTATGAANLTFTTNTSFNGAVVNLGLGANVTITTGNSTNRVLMVNSVSKSLFASKATLSGDVSDVVVSSLAEADLLSWSNSSSAFVNRPTSGLSVNNSTNFAGQPASYYTNASNMSSGTLPAARLTGTYNITANNASYLSGLTASYFVDAGNMSTGTLPIARLDGSYPLITAVGNLTSLIVTGNVTSGGYATFGANSGISTGSGTQALYVSSAAGTRRSLDLRTVGSNRWGIAATSDAEGGSSTGSDFVITRYNDAGSVVDNVIRINRDTGAIVIGSYLNNLVTSIQKTTSTSSFALSTVVNILDIATTTAAFTVVLPADPKEGEMVKFLTRGAITSLTVSASHTVRGAPSSMTSGSAFTAHFTGSVWFVES